MHTHSRILGAHLTPWLASALMLVACSPGAQSPTSPDGNEAAEVAARYRPQASAASVEHERVINAPTETLQFIPCANGGAGEVVDFLGTMHLIDHAVLTGRRVSVFQVAEMHETGIGLTTGDKYESSLAYHFEPVNGSLVNGQFTTSFTAQTGITGPGPGNNMYFPTMIHVTVNAAGEITAEVERFPVTCK